MKTVLVAGMAVTLVAAGAGGAYLFMNKPAEATIAAPSEIEKAEEAKAAAALAKPAPKAIFVELDPLILPILDENGVSQVVSMVVSVEVPDDIAAEAVKNMQPRLKDAFIQDMYGVLSRQAVTTGGTLEVGKIKARLNSISQKIMGPDKVKEVLLQVVQQRPV